MTIALETWMSLASILVALVGFATLFMRLGRWGERLERRLDVTDGRIDVLAAWASGFSREMNTFLGLIVRLLHSRQALDDVEMGAVAQGLVNLATPAVEALFERERRAGNPFTSEEL